MDATTGRKLNEVEREMLADQQIPKSVRKELMKVLKKPQYFHQNLKEDKAYNVGNTANAFLGFDECALPVVLSHNTPNNSLPILWQDTDNDEEFKGLFPRISRH